jgi:hypothetical protein
VKAEMMHERALQKPKRPPQQAARPDKPHNWGVRAGKVATVSYEVSNGRPSRKSTRASEHHQRATNALERTQQYVQQRATNRATAAKARAAKVSGKAR